MNRFRLSVRARILSIALIPSGVLLAVGVGAATTLAVQGFQLRSEVTEVKSGSGPSIQFAETLQEERRLSLLVLSGDRSAGKDLAAGRKRVDTVLASPELLQAQQTIADLAPETAEGLNDTSEDIPKLFAQVRQGIDAGVVPPDQVYQFFNGILDRILIGVRGMANNLPDADAVALGSVSVDLVDALESMSRSNALGVAVVDRMSPAQLLEYSKQVGSYHSRISALVPSLKQPERARVEALVNSPSWKTLSTMEDAIVTRGMNTGGPLPMSVADWQKAADAVNAELLGLFQDHNNAVIDGALDSASETATWWLVAGIAMLLAALAASLVTLRISGGLIQRLRRLRTEALAVADQQLPQIMTRLRSGENVDAASGIQPLDFGDDEIGDVADAFNRAESSAVAAAIEEAKTRGGINALFLNIAHRSQIVVHRQLELLDRAEHGEEDPTRLAVLFELDHLSTRARRNAENLIILGGEQPGRQWRNPVPLVELVRSAIAETEDYSRVNTGHVAGVSIVGNVVADLIHLVAELVENATSFSPPETRVEVTGAVVGRGAVVEIVDQGLGMTREQIEQANEILREPPNFSVVTLSSDSRMGLRVVGQIAARNGVSIRLSESDYGGIRAIVLIPTSLTVADDPRHVVGVGATTGTMPGYHAVERNGASIPIAPRVPPVPWPTMDPGEVTPPPFVTHRESHQESHGAHAAPAEPYGAHAEPRVARHEQPSEIPPTALEQGIQPTAGRPTLPRRRRQESLVPQLVDIPPQSKPNARRERSSEQVRDLFSAIESGTRQGRQARSDANPDRREGQR